VLYLNDAMVYFDKKYIVVKLRINAYIPVQTPFIVLGVSLDAPIPLTPLKGAP
jgi:hypothetical protein